jgi:hypothetical protein
MTISRYSIDSLARDLREFEGRYGMASDDFYETYRTDEVPADIPGFEGFIWADAYQELCRLRDVVPARSAQPVH